MRRADIIGSLIIIVFSIFAVTQAAQIDYWWKFGPGPGFLPLWASILMVLGGCLLLVQSLRKPKAEKKDRVDPHRYQRLFIVATVAGLTVLTAVAIIYLGFSIAIFLFMAMMLGVLGKYRWHITVGIAACVSLVFYLIFAQWLQVPLPSGILGF